MIFDLGKLWPNLNETSVDASQDENSVLIKPEILEERESSKVEDRNSRSLLIVAFLFSLDDLPVLVSNLVGQSITILELLSGTAIASVLTVLACLVVGTFKPVVRFLELIPVFATMFAFGSYLTIKSLLMK